MSADAARGQLARLQAARRELNAARDACPHWDYESEGNAHHPCCDTLHEARDELARAMRSINRTRAGVA